MPSPVIGTTIGAFGLVACARSEYKASSAKPEWDTMKPKRRRDWATLAMGVVTSGTVILEAGFLDSIKD